MRCFVNIFSPFSNLGGGGDTDAVLVIYDEWKNRSFIWRNGSQTWGFSYFLLSCSGSNPLDSSKILRYAIPVVCSN